MDTEPLASLLLFEGVDQDELVEFASRAELTEVPLGSVLAESGDLSYMFFVVIHGLAAVTMGNEQIATIGRGEFLGEIGILDERRRSANVVAITPMQLAAMRAWDFLEVMDTMPTVAARIKIVAEERREEDEERARE